MAWFFIFVAGLLEVAWAVGLKASQGLTRPGLTAFTLVTMILSFVVLSQGMKTLPVGTAYTVWTGIGAVGSVVLGILLLGESRDPLRLACLAWIIVGILALRFLAPEG